MLVGEKDPETTVPVVVVVVVAVVLIHTYIHISLSLSPPPPLFFTGLREIMPPSGSGAHAARPVQIDSLGTASSAGHVVTM